MTNPLLPQPVVTANATSAAAPASIELAAPAGFASYAWSTEGACGTAVTLGNAPGGVTSRTLTLTSGAGSGSVFNLGAGAPATVACGLQVTVTNGVGNSATSATTQVMVRC